MVLVVRNLLTIVPGRSGRVFNRSRATRAVALDISKTFGRVWYAGLLHNFKSNGNSSQNLALFRLFSVIDGFVCPWMGGLYKNIKLMLESLTSPFLLIHFPYYTLMTFLMMLFVILLSIQMTLLSTLSVIRHLICGNN